MPFVAKTNCGTEFTNRCRGRISASLHKTDVNYRGSFHLNRALLLNSAHQRWAVLLFSTRMAAVYAGGDRDIHPALKGPVWTHVKNCMAIGRTGIGTSHSRTRGKTGDSKPAGARI